MGYLVKNDYKSYIQGDQLLQLTQGDDEKRLQAEQQAVQDVFNRISQRYNLDMEFTDTLPYSTTRTYKVGERAVVALATGGFTTWAASTSYALGAPVIYQGNGYFCTTANSDATFTPGNWEFAGATNTIFYAAWPDTCTRYGEPNPATLLDPYAPLFDYRKIYKKDDVVYWKGNTWVCNMDSVRISHTTQLQFVDTYNLPYGNVFPDDTALNSTYAYWKTPTEYVVEPGTPLTDTTAWVKGDNRNQTIKLSMVVLSVFRLSPTLAPHNRPEVWLEDFKQVLRDLNAAAQGEMTLILPAKQPVQGLKTRAGSQVKNVNNY